MTVVFASSKESVLVEFLLAAIVINSTHTANSIADPSGIRSMLDGVQMIGKRDENEGVYFKIKVLRVNKLIFGFVQFCIPYQAI